MAYSAKVMEHFANPHNVGELPDANGIGEVAIATSSMATDLVKGKTIEEALKLTNQAVMEALDGLPPVKIHCSVLAEQAIKAAVSDYYRRIGIDPVPIVGEIRTDADELACSL